MHKVKLNPCPFCKYTPNLDIAKDFWGNRYYKVRCRNDWCFVNPSTVWYCVRNDAVESWNYDVAMKGGDPQ